MPVDKPAAINNRRGISDRVQTSSGSGSTISRKTSNCCPASLRIKYQTKVESASKYRIRFSGIVLFNLFGNSGSVENQDVPTWSIRPDSSESSGSVGGTMRQSILGFETFGPDFLGAHTSANVNFDFGGGFPATYNGVDSALVRLRTAAARLDWKDTSVIVGQDQLFLSPLVTNFFRHRHRSGAIVLRQPVVMDAAVACGTSLRDVWQFDDNAPRRVHGSANG